MFECPVGEQWEMRLRLSTADWSLGWRLAFVRGTERIPMWLY